MFICSVALVITHRPDAHLLYIVYKFCAHDDDESWLACGLWVASAPTMFACLVISPACWCCQVEEAMPAERIPRKPPQQPFRAHATLYLNIPASSCAGSGNVSLGGHDVKLWPRAGCLAPAMLIFNESAVV